MAVLEAKFFIKMFYFWPLFVCCELDDRNVMFFGITNGLIEHPASYFLPLYLPGYPEASICIRVLPIKVSDGIRLK
jgi:hypothetical protein